MAWKRLTYGQVNYFVNINEIAYIQEHENVSTIVFSARAEHGSLRINIDQKPHEILSGEDVSSVADGEGRIEE